MDPKEDFQKSCWLALANSPAPFCREKFRASLSDIYPARWINAVILAQDGQVDGLRNLAAEFNEGDLVQAMLGQGGLPPMTALWRQFCGSAIDHGFNGQVDLIPVRFSTENQESESASQLLASLHS
jgi:hypothetical protein